MPQPDPFSDPLPPRPSVRAVADFKSRARLFRFAVSARSSVRGGFAPAAAAVCAVCHRVLSRLTGYAQMNAAVPELFTRAAKLAGADAVFPVRQGDDFLLDGVEYEVIWPPETGFPFPQELADTVDAVDSMLSAPFLPMCAREFLELRECFCAAYLRMCSSAPLREEDVEETQEWYRRICTLIPDLLLLPVAGEVSALLSADETQEAYSNTLNAACAVFQNIRRGVPDRMIS
jgi:hypothetical protein